MKQFLLIFIPLFCLFTSAAQQPEPVENIRVFTDRTLYISGETIRFEASINPGTPFPENQESRVLYSELSTADGSVIQRGKYRILQGSVSACITIPPEAVTGYYYLRCYTRRLRNAGPMHFHHSLIKILHPENPEVLSNPAENGFADSNWFVRPEPAKNIQLVLDKKAYKPGETIHVSVSSPGKEAAANVSVIPSGSYTAYRSFPGNFTSSGESQLLPETSGVSLSGRVIDKQTGKPVAKALVNLSIIGDKDMMARYSDSTGRFAFSLPEHTGTGDLFISAGSNSSKELTVQVDNDFCPLKSALPSPGFRLDSLETAIALSMIRNRIIAEEYSNPLPEPSPVTMNKDVLPFYGNKCETLILDQYIDLPTLEDYITELPVMLRVRKADGRKTIRFITDKPEMTIYRPLVMIDWLAIDDMESILAVSPLEIERIEIINAPYIKGDITFGGIISFISRKHNFAGIDLPKSGTFINYEFFHPACLPLSAPSGSHMPDFRNTLFWDTIALTPGKMTGISLVAPSTPGYYEVLVRRNGTTEICRELFRVE